MPVAHATANVGVRSSAARAFRCRTGVPRDAASPSRNRRASARSCAPMASKAARRSPPAVVRRRSARRPVDGAELREVVDGGDEASHRLVVLCACPPSLRRVVVLRGPHAVGFPPSSTSGWRRPSPVGRRPCRERPPRCRRRGPPGRSRGAGRSARRRPPRSRRAALARATSWPPASPCRPRWRPA